MPASPSSALRANAPFEAAFHAHRFSAMMIAAIRSARAPMVREGFTPRALGMMAAVGDVEVSVSEYFAAVIDDAVSRGVAQVAAAQRVWRDQVFEKRPGRRHHRGSAGGFAQADVHRDDRVDQRCATG